MKLFNKIALIAVFLCTSLLTYAQKPTTGCNDLNIQEMSEGIKLGLKKQGMLVFQEAMIHMTSMEPVPIAVKMTKGITYQLIFVGSENANKMSMEIYDGADKKIDEQMERGAKNNIVYSFTPSKTDVYLITLIQKKGVKDMCGYFGVMMKGTDARSATAIRQAPSQNIPAKTPTTATPVKTNTNNTNNYQSMPANQRPNSSRTKATNQAQPRK